MSDQPRVNRRCANGRETAGCSGVFKRAAGFLRRGNGSRESGAAGGFECARYGLHGEAGGRFPDGRARNMTDGILRKRYRDSLENPKLTTPGEVYKVTIDAGVTSNVFLAGHRIRVEISSSNFPRFDPQSRTPAGSWRKRRARTSAKRYRRCTMNMSGIRTLCCRWSLPRLRNWLEASRPAMFPGAIREHQIP
jgi:hypothetical protein